jgi:hypothetical protein
LNQEQSRGGGGGGGGGPAAGREMCGMKSGRKKGEEEECNDKKISNIRI